MGDMRWLKVGVIVLCALVLTALGIDAADTLSGSRSTLLGQVISSTSEGSCPSGMVEVPMATTFRCVDLYEASASEECPHQSPRNELQTQENMSEPACMAQSEAAQDAWRFLTREQAFTACMRAGKRLPQSAEWHLVAAGTSDTQNCNINSNGVVATGKNEACVSAVGVFDAIGNVWEWTSDDVIEGTYNGRALPASGFVTQVDNGGVAVLTGSEPSELFFKDYFWSVSQGAFGMLRGGYYGSRDDAGVYAIHADTPPTTSGTAIGFRCVL